MKRKQQQDLSTLKKFNKVFVKECKGLLPECSLYHDQGLSSFGAQTIYKSNIHVPEMLPAKAKRIGLIDKTLVGLIWLESEVNPNGVTGKDNIARTYTIHVKFFGNRKHTQRRWEHDVFIGFYNYALTVEQAVREFKWWLENVFQNFLQDVQTGKYHWQKNYQGYDQLFKQK